MKTNIVFDISPDNHISRKILFLKWYAKMLSANQIAGFYKCNISRKKQGRQNGFQSGGAMEHWKSIVGHHAWPTRKIFEFCTLWNGLNSIFLTSVTAF